jgi:hypothetical protein
MRFGTWIVQNLHRSGLLRTVASELAKLDLMRVQEVRWDKNGNKPANSYTFFYGNRNANHHFGTGSQQLRGSNLLVVGYHI